MCDRDFLVWIHARLKQVHGENPNVDYMQKLSSIINSMDLKRHSPNIAQLTTLNAADTASAIDLYEHNLHYQARNRSQELLRGQGNRLTFDDLLLEVYKQGFRDCNK